MSRKLVTIQKILDISPIPNAETIELARVMGWDAVVKKGEFNVGDPCVYFEVDSFLPIEDRYEFLRKNSYRTNKYIGEGFRVKTMRLRGTLSQGLIMPLSAFPKIPSNTAVGEDVTAILKVKKWELPEIEGGAGVIIGNKPYGIPTTDELRVQSALILFEKLLEKSYYIATKMDGTSMTVYYKDLQVGVCGRNDEYKDTIDCRYWSCAHQYNLPQKLKKYGKNIAIQGEFCGREIRGNKLKLLTPKFYVFDILDLNTHKYYNLIELRDTCEALGLDMVPVEEIGSEFKYSMEDLLKRAKGSYSSGIDKEGIVVRPIFPEYCLEAGNRLSFKVLNNSSLLKEKN